MHQSIHESSNKAPSPGSDRSFGGVMAGALALLSLFNGWHLGRLWPWTLSAAVLFLVAAWIRPSSLHPLNLLWTKLSWLLHKFFDPILMGFVFYGTILPTGLLMRLRGKDLLRLKREPDGKTYWIARAPGPAPETMRDQF